MVYPENLLRDLSPLEEEFLLKIVKTGGYKYNEYGECCLSEEDEDGVDYSSYCTQDELDESIKRMKLMREEIIKQNDKPKDD